jgi:hypothetical protein
MDDAEFHPASLNVLMSSHSGTAASHQKDFTKGWIGIFSDSYDDDHIDSCSPGCSFVSAAAQPAVFFSQGVT